MKKILLFLVGLFVIVIPFFVNAQTANVSTIIGNFNIAQGIGPSVDIALASGTTVQDGVGKFNFQITHRTTDPNIIRFTLSKDGQVVINEEIYINQISEPVGAVKTVSKEVSGLTPGEYTIKVMNGMQNQIVYGQKSFTVIANQTPQNPTNPPTPETITATDYGLTASVTNNQGISLEIQGIINPLKDISGSQLKVQYKGSDDTDFQTLPKNLLNETSATVNLVKGQSKNFTYTISALRSGTQYQIRIIDSQKNPGIILWNTTHTTAGTTPSQGGTNVNDGILASDYGLPILSVTPAEKTALLKGEVIPQKTITNAQLYVFFGTSRDNLIQAKPFFGQASVTLQSGESKSFDYTFDNLQPGTDYFYKIRDIGRNLDVTTGILAFKTLGNMFEDPESKDPTNPTNPTVGGDPYVFDPNAQDGIFGNYTYPTNLGQPDSDGSTNRLDLDTPLVPCGKSSDEGTEDETCRFSHVIVLINNLITFGLIMMVPLIALICIYAGVMMIIKRQAPEELTQIKKRFSRIGVGILVMLLAWTLVATVFNSLVSDNSKAIILLDLTDLG